MVMLLAAMNVVRGVARLYVVMLVAVGIKRKRLGKLPKGAEQSSVTAVIREVYYYLIRCSSL